MSVNSSSSTNFVLFDVKCLLTGPSSIIFTTHNIIFVFLLLPLCIFILHHGLQQWMKKRSTSSASTMSHCDFFTYQLVVMVLVGVLGQILCCCGVYIKNVELLGMGCIFTVFMWFGETFFHLLTCVERYLAVVHPITYLSLRGERGVRLRNISVVCVWLISFVCIGLLMMNSVAVALIPCLLIIFLTFVSFCSLSVLCVLIGPGPGEQGGGWARVDQSKKRAFYTIITIQGVLMLRFTYSLVWAGVNASEVSASVKCVFMTTSMYLSLPSSQLLPLLFLYREGKLVCCKKNNQQRREMQK